MQWISPSGAILISLPFWQLHTVMKIKLRMQKAWAPSFKCLLLTVTAAELERYQNRNSCKTRESHIMARKCQVWRFKQVHLNENPPMARDLELDDL